MQRTGMKVQDKEYKIGYHSFTILHTNQSVKIGLRLYKIGLMLLSTNYSGLEVGNLGVFWAITRPELS